MRDPFDPERREYFGPVLAGVLAKQPSKLILLETSGTCNRTAYIIEQAIRLFPALEIETICLDLSDPSDYDAVDIELRMKLKKMASTKQKLTVNLSPGTPQLTTTLAVLLATGFLEGESMKVSDPRFSKGVPGNSPQNSRHSRSSSLTSIAESAPLTEPTEAAAGRTISSATCFSIVEHICRSNAVKLCERYDYSGAEVLLSSSANKKKYNKLARPLIRFAAHLMLLDVESARKEFESIENQVLDRWNKAGHQIRETIQMPEVVILYLATQIKLELKRIDDFVRCAGLTREVLLAYYFDLPAVRELYGDALHSAGTGARYLRKDELPAEFVADYRRQLEKLQEFDGTKFDESSRIELMARSMQSIIQIAADRSLLSPSIADAIVASQELAYYRNKSAHEIRVLNSSDIRTIKTLFSKLRILLPFDMPNDRSLPPLFKPVNLILKDMLLYWTD
ncbi:MAG: hypothetical protein K8F91_12850 [Candidatus Obscuribacterales bacterium]|nr:hypothetical protein [Candidatus Obscuribacterales bacterium]